MGEGQTAIALAAIYQQSDRINSAGGHLRSLTDKAREGKFFTWPCSVLSVCRTSDSRAMASSACGKFC